MFRNMSQSLSSLLVHLIFSTKDRCPFLGKSDLLQPAHAYLGGILRRVQCPAITIGGTADHVHAFFQLAPTQNAAKVVEILKATRPGHAPYRQDAYATLLAPPSTVADAQSSIGFQPVFSAPPRSLQARCLCYLDETHSTVIFSCTAPFRPVACRFHSPGASCQKKRPSG